MKINLKLCKLCGDCADACVNDAIEIFKDFGNKRGEMAYRINKKKCIDCKVCLSICENNAIIDSSE